MKEKAKTLLENINGYTWPEINSVLRELNTLKSSDQEASELWNKIKSASTHIREQHINGIENAEKSRQAAKKSERANYSAQIKKLLSSNISDKELKFVTDIQRKRTLTEKQAKWLCKIAAKKGIKIDLSCIKIKQSKINVQHCEHEDLGSLGYTHGETVICPFCGQKAIVW